MSVSKLLLPFIVVGLLVWCSLFFFVPEVVWRISYARESARQKAIAENLPNLKQADGLSTLFREVSNAVKPAVVEIRVSQKTEKGMRIPRGSEGGAIGSGVIIDRENGYVVTNEHVISGDGEITVILADGRKLSAAASHSQKSNSRLRPLVCSTATINPPSSRANRASATSPS